MTALNHLLRTLVLGGFAVLAWLGYDEYRGFMDGHKAEIERREARIQELNGVLDEQLEANAVLRDEIVVKEEAIAGLEVDLAASEARVAELDMALDYLKIDHRLARLAVVDQEETEEGTLTTVRFEELGLDGLPLGQPAEYVLPGKVAYLESLVIKFDDGLVERGDAWRGTSVCLFRRLFSERQSPQEGQPLDTVGQSPLPYADDRSPELVAALWTRFWDYANDPEAADAAGVRAIHGEAPFIELRDGASYLVELRSSGGLSLRRE